MPALAMRQHLWPVPPMGVLNKDRVRMWVRPSDIDINLHLNNARCLHMTDYARTHLLAWMGLLEPIVRARLKTIVGGVLRLTGRG
jgi:hypothetical protein